MPETIDGVVVDHADGLHEGIADSGADKPEAALFQFLAQGFRIRGFGGDIRQAFPVVAYRFVVDELPDIRIETAELRLNLEKYFGIGNSRLDFEPVADDALILEQLTYLSCIVICYTHGIKPVQGLAKVFTFFQDRHPA